MSRTINFDELEQVECVIGGRTFILKPQRRSLLQRILTEAFKEHENNDKDSLVDGMFKNFERQLPTFPLMFGYEDPKSEEYKDTLTHFKEWLTPKIAESAFETWWILNGVEDFFLRAGMALYPPNLVEGMRERFKEEVSP